MSYLLNVAYLATIAVGVRPGCSISAFATANTAKGWAAKFWAPCRAQRRQPCVWLHAVSVGEVNLLLPILERWERLHPDWECVISTTTQAGYHLAVKKYAPRMVIYCPLDFTWAVRQAMRRIAA